MLDPSVHGVALVKVSAGPIDPREFYGVFFRGVLQPTQFRSWTDANAHFQKMETAN